MQVDVRKADDGYNIGPPYVKNALRKYMKTGEMPPESVHRYLSNLTEEQRNKMVFNFASQGRTTDVRLTTVIKLKYKDFTMDGQEPQSDVYEGMKNNYAIMERQSQISNTGYMNYIQYELIAKAKGVSGETYVTDNVDVPVKVVASILKLYKTQAFVNSVRRTRFTLKEAVENALQRIEKEEENRKLLATLEENHKNVVKTTDNTHFIAIDDIICLKSDGSYTNIITTTKNVLASRHLKYFAGILSNCNYIRTHQSYLVNPKHIEFIEKTGELQLSNKDVAPVATRKRAEILKEIKSIISP